MHTMGHESTQFKQNVPINGFFRHPQYTQDLFLPAPRQRHSLTSFDLLHMLFDPKHLTVSLSLFASLQSPQPRALTSTPARMSLGVTTWQQQHSRTLSY